MKLPIEIDKILLYTIIEKYGGGTNEKTLKW